MLSSVGKSGSHSDLFFFGSCSGAGDVQSLHGTAHRWLPPPWLLNSCTRPLPGRICWGIRPDRQACAWRKHQTFGDFTYFTKKHGGFYGDVGCNWDVLGLSGKKHIGIWRGRTLFGWWLLPLWNLVVIHHKDPRCSRCVSVCGISTYSLIMVDDIHCHLISSSASTQWVTFI